MRRFCREHKIELNLQDSEFIDCGGRKVRGVFDEETLSCAVGKPLKEWLPILVHEFSHLEQLVDKDPKYFLCYLDEEHEVDVVILHEHWLNKRIEIPPETLLDYTIRIREMELNNEKRAVANFKKHHLPIDVKNYTRRANAYVLFYNVSMYLRKWYEGKDGKCVCDDPRILELMSDQFDMCYEVLDPQTFLTYADLLR